MVDIKVSGDRLDCELLGWSKLWAFRSHLEIPLASIKSLSVGGELPKGFYLRVLGTGFPRKIAAGMFTDFKRWAFFDVRADRTNVITMELAGWKYDVVALEVTDAHADARMIREAMAARGIAVAAAPT